MTGRDVCAALIAIGLATAVVPPVVAWSVNRARVNRAARDVSALAARLRVQDDALRRLSTDTDVLYAPGQMPTSRGPETQRWMSLLRTSLSRALVDANPSTDPWGNSYIVNVGVLRSGGSPALWILSAGPNGVVEMPFLAGSNSSTAGDDVAVRIW